MKIQSNCPVCDGTVTLNSDVEATEVVSCSECKSRLVVESIDKEKKTATLAKAPDVEEDWGE
jgi:lysine biosynthesis protein LysW